MHLLRTSPDPISAPRAAGPARSPADLESHETPVASAFGVLPRLDAGPELLDAVMERFEAETAPVAVVRPRQLAFGAAAALLLAVLGTWAFQDAASSADEAAVAARPVRAPRALVIEDPSMTLFHGLETFEGVNVEPGDLLALGDE